MFKRLAETQLTPEELAKNINGENTHNEAEVGLADQATLSQRKIVKVKRHMAGDVVKTEEGKGVFQLIGDLTTK